MREREGLKGLRTGRLDFEERGVYEEGGGGTYT